MDLREARMVWRGARLMRNDCGHDPRTTGGGFALMGASAFRRGGPITANPMREGSRAWEAWRAGWQEAAKTPGEDQCGDCGDKVRPGDETCPRCGAA